MLIRETDKQRECRFRQVTDGRNPRKDPGLSGFFPQANCEVNRLFRPVNAVQFFGGILVLQFAVIVEPAGGRV